MWSIRAGAALPAERWPDSGDLARILGRGGALEGQGVDLRLDCKLICGLAVWAAPSVKDRYGEPERGE
jgi:hypothetical protein